ncbi:MAG: hypothetical protein ACTSSG_00890 [Candidatus Heimdallarchaeaceae archaeon]
MKLKKKLLLSIFVVMFLISLIPRNIQAAISYSYEQGRIIEVSNDEYLLVYKKDMVSNEVAVEQKLRSRIMKQTATEFQTIESNDTDIIDWEFEYHGRDFIINQTALVYYNEKTYLFLAVDDTTTNELSFFAKYTVDNGVTWSDLIWVYNTSMPFSHFDCFDVSYLGSQLFLAYSYATTPQFLPTSTALFINPSNFIIVSNTTTIQQQDFYGEDFELLTHGEGSNQRVYITSTDPTTPGKVRLTYTTTGSTLAFPWIQITPPNGTASLFHPTLAYWDKESVFVVIAHDIMTDYINPAQNLFSEEYMLWGATVKDVGFSETIENMVVVKDEVDGYFRRNPSLSIYQGELFLCFEVGQGRRFGAITYEVKSDAGTYTKKVTEINFVFSDNGKLWKNNYLGHVNWFLNPGIYFIIATVVIFSIVLPLNYFLKKRGK